VVNLEILKVMKLKILQVIFFLASSIGYCCSCVDLTGRPVLELINSHEQIFEGIITKIDSENEFYLTAEFIIKRNIKGVKSLSKIKVRTLKSEAMCGIYFEKGQNWLIFSNSNQTGLCDGNIKLENCSLKEFTELIAHNQHKFYFSKLFDFLNQIKRLKENTELIEYDKESNIIAKGKIIKDKQPIGNWIYKDVPTEEIIVKVKN